jgi:hypothetical protein
MKSYRGKDKMKEEEENGGTKEKGLEKKGAGGKVQGRSSGHERYKSQGRKVQRRKNQGGKIKSRKRKMSKVQGRSARDGRYKKKELLRTDPKRNCQ